MKKLLVLTVDHPRFTPEDIAKLCKSGYEIEASGLSDYPFTCQTCNILAIHREYSELEMILNLIELNRNDDLVLYINSIDKPIENFMESLIESGYNKIFIKSTELNEVVPDVYKYYVPFYDNDWNPDVIKHAYREFSDKSKLLPTNFFPKNWKYKTVNSIFVPRGLGQKLIGTFHNLHKDGYNFTRFGKATFYPLAIMLESLVEYMVMKNGSSN